MKLKFYIWIMGWSGKIHAWAWVKQVNILEKRREERYFGKRQEENEEYLKELKNKL